MIQQTALRQKLYKLLGDLPQRNRPVSCLKISEEDRGSYILEKLFLDLNGYEGVPAYLVKPRNMTGSLPLVIYNHGHGCNYEIAKEEILVGRPSLQKPSYAEFLTKKGYIGFCMDAWNFGERRGRSESELFKELLWKGQTLWGLMIYDSIKAIDYLTSRKDVDANRIATIGISMGSTMAWWLAALDERIKVCIDICCLTDFSTLIETRGLDGHGLYYFVPGLLKHFDTAGINSLIAPRPHLSLAGNYDKLTPPAGLLKIDTVLKTVYKKLNKSAAWKLLRYEIGHFETAHMRHEIEKFFIKFL